MAMKLNFSYIFSQPTYACITQTNEKIKKKLIVTNHISHVQKKNT